MAIKHGVREAGLVLLCLGAAAAGVLSGCSSGSMKAPPPSVPVFTSTPVTVASQGVLYAYMVTATDSAGGTVAFSLSASPARATLNGGALSWTPAAVQSRVSNMFTVTASTT